MRFTTSIHCMDGRIQLPLLKYIMKVEQVDYVDSITEPGPCKILSDRSDQQKVRSIQDRLDISINIHNSAVIYISGHYNCAGNPIENQEQIDQVYNCMSWLQKTYDSVKVVGLWINEEWEVEKLKVPF